MVAAECRVRKQALMVVDGLLRQARQRRPAELDDARSGVLAHALAHAVASSSLASLSTRFSIPRSTPRRSRTSPRLSSVRGSTVSVGAMADTSTGTRANAGLTRSGEELGARASNSR